MKTMIHGTPGYNTEPITRLGICTRYATDAWKRLWLALPSKEAWVRQHVALRHGCDPSEVTIFFVTVEDSTLHRQLPGLYWSEDDVPAGNIRAIKLGRAEGQSWGW